MPQVRLLRQS